MAKFSMQFRADKRTLVQLTEANYQQNNFTPGFTYPSMVEVAISWSSPVVAVRAVELLLTAPKWGPKVPQLDPCLALRRRRLQSGSTRGEALQHVYYPPTMSSSFVFRFSNFMTFWIFALAPSLPPLLKAWPDAVVHLDSSNKRWPPLKPLANNPLCAFQSAAEATNLFHPHRTATFLLRHDENLDSQIENLCRQDLLISRRQAREFYVGQHAKVAHSWQLAWQARASSFGRETKEMIFDLNECQGDRRWRKETTIMTCCCWRWLTKESKNFFLNALIYFVAFVIKFELLLQFIHLRCFSLPHPPVIWQPRLL